MTVKVYRSLDCPSSLFGMKGAYLLLFVGALALKLWADAATAAKRSRDSTVPAFLIVLVLSIIT